MPDKYTESYDTPAKVLAVVENMQYAERIRAENRSLVNRLMNGERPWSDEQVKKLQIQFAVNWGEGSTMMMRANTQINGALLHKGNFFIAKLLKGPPEKRDEWSQVFTEAAQEPMKRGRSGKRYMYLLKSRNASLTMHGIGPLMWMNDFDWMPRFVPLEDLLIPTDTFLDFGNLTHFAVNLYPTPYELFDMVISGQAQQGWNKKAVKRILGAYKGINSNPFNYDWYNQPEKMAEIWKQNRACLDNDSVPVVRLVAYYWRATESTTQSQKWYRKIVLKEVPSSKNSDALPPDPDDFVFSWDKPFANHIDEILHVQFGDCSLVAPLKYQSVRGLGTSLYAVIECMNRLRCQFAQHVFEQFLMYFRITNPAMQDRPKQMQMFPFGVIPEGVNLIPKNERHSIDASLVDRLMNEVRQLMSENSASYVQDIDKGNQGNPITATEANIRLQSVNVIVSSMLNMLYTQENFCYEEIVRRFLNKTSEDPDIKKFREKCKRAGIPDEYMEPDCWQIDAERVFGGGDQMLAENEVTKLLALSPQLDPSAQRLIKRQYVSVITRDPAKGRLLVPEDPNQVTDGRREAETAFGCIMADALPRSLPEGIEREDYIETLLQMSEAKMTAIAQTDNIGSPQEIMGLQAVLQHIGENIQVLASDVSKKELVKQFGDTLGQLENVLKGFAQRLAEQMSEGEQDPQAEAEIAVMVKKAATENIIKTRKAAQDYEIRQKKFEQNAQQSMAKFQQEFMQTFEKHRQELLAQVTQTKADLISEKALTEAEIENKKKVASATATATTQLPKKKDN